MAFTDYTVYIASGITLGLAFVAQAFGYGKLNQDVANIKENHKDDIGIIRKSFEDFIEDNQKEHEIIFAEFRKVVKHIGAVEKYMEMRNGKDKS